jgi:acetyl esterase/lipase
MHIGVRSAVRSLTILLLAIANTNARTTSAQTDRKSDVIYGRRAGLALTLEVITPTRANGLGVVWVVSSGGRSSREQTLEPSFERRIAPLLTHGYTVFAVIHGSSPAFNVQDAIDDVRRAVRFIRHSGVEFGIDTKRLGIAGSSAGGSIALTVAMNARDGDPASQDPVERMSSRVQVAGSFFAPTDFVHFGSDRKTLFDAFRERGVADPSFQFYDEDSKTGARTPIADEDRLLHILDEISPASYVTRDDPPTVLIHGTADQAVPVQQSQRLADRLNAAHVEVRLVLREGMRHAWPGWEADTEIIAQWFDAHLSQTAAR